MTTLKISLRKLLFFVDVRRGENFFTSDVIKGMAVVEKLNRFE